MNLRQILAIVMLVMVVYIFAGGTIILSVLSVEKSELAERNTIPIFWKYFSSRAKNFFSSTVDYALYTASITNAEKDGFPSFDEFVKAIEEKIKLNTVISFKDKQISVSPKIKAIAIGETTKINVIFDIKYSGESFTSEREFFYPFEIENNLGVIYEKAKMFYDLGIQGKGIACLNWDGNGNIELKYFALDGKKRKVMVYWSGNDASLISTNGNSKEENGKTIVTCELSNGESCSIDISLSSGSLKFHKALVESDCNSLECGDFTPLLLEKGKNMEICINTFAKIPERIEDEISALLPKEIEGSSTCDRPGLKTAEQVLAEKFACSGDLEECIEEKLKEYLKENVFRQIEEQESKNGIKVELNLNFDYFDIEVKDEKTCSWVKVCSQCVCTQKNVGVKIPRYALSKYEEKEFAWKLPYKSEIKEIEGSDLAEISCPSSESCSGFSCPCSPSQACEEKTLSKWKYSYSYSYSYTLEITIKDENHKIIIAK